MILDYLGGLTQSQGSSGEGVGPESEKLEDVMILALKVKEKTTSQGMQMASRKKGKKWTLPITSGRTAALLIP